MGAKSKRKGKVGEQEASRELSRLFHVETRRGQQFHGSPDSPDVVGLPGIHVEVKRTEKLSIYAAIDQAVGDAGEGIPLVVHRRNEKPWLAVVRLDDLPKLCVQGYLILASGDTGAAEAEGGEE